MHPNALLDLSAQLLERVLRFDAPADSLVSSFLRAHKELGQRERHTLAETTYQVLRERLRYQHLAAGGAAPPFRRLAILGWQGAHYFLHSGMSDEERAWLERARKAEAAGLPDKLRHNLPDWLSGQLLEQFGAEDFWPAVQALNRPAALDLRVNVLKAKREAVQAALAELGISAAPTPYSPWGLRLADKPALQLLPAFKQGDFEVQDEGSQLLALLLDARRGEMVVDFCAGAGGKTLAIGAAMRNTGRLYAFDTSGHRLAALKPRLARSGLSNVYAVQIAHERDDRIKRLAGKIDRVLIDAPCSGLGTLRRNPDLKWRQTPGSIVELPDKQRAILASAARLLKPGGRLVYATCSLLRAENEVIADEFTQAQAGNFTVLPAATALAEARVAQPETLTEGAHLRLWPHRHATDGFFAAVWQRV